jgi:hypothetical protein
MDPYEKQCELNSCGSGENGLCELGSEPSGSIKVGKFVDRMRDW